MKFGLFTAFALALGLAACGGTEPAPQNAAGKEHCEHCKQGEPCEHCKTGQPCDCKPGEHGEHAKHGEHAGPAGRHEEIKGPVGDFHAVLSPVYHAPKGAERTVKVCEQGTTMHDKAAAVESSAAPAAAKADDYKAAAKGLSSAVDGLVAACAAAGRPDVDTKLEALHDAFHKLIEVPGVMPPPPAGPPPGAPPGPPPGAPPPH